MLPSDETTSRDPTNSSHHANKRADERLTSAFATLVAWSPYRPQSFKIAGRTHYFSGSVPLILSCSTMRDRRRIPMNPMTWNDLPAINEAMHLDSTDEQCLDDIRTVVEKHRKTGALALRCLINTSRSGKTSCLLSTVITNSEPC